MQSAYLFYIPCMIFVRLDSTAKPVTVDIIGSELIFSSEVGKNTLQYLVIIILKIIP